MKIKRFHSDAAGVVDLAEAEKFFQEVLGAKVLPEKQRRGIRRKAVWLGTEEPYRIELVECIDESLDYGKAVKKLAPSYMCAIFEVENLDEAIAELRAKGLTVSDKKPLEDPEYEELYQCVIHPKSACGLAIELLEIKGKRPQAGEY